MMVRRQRISIEHPPTNQLLDLHVEEMQPW